MNRLEKEVEEAILLGYRFPDLSEQEVMDHVDDIVGNHTPTNPESYFGRIVLMAYESKSVKAVNRFMAAFGSVQPLDMEQPEDPS